MEDTTGIRKDRHRKVRCSVCGKYMLSNKLKRHSRAHDDILNMSKEEAREELRNRNAVYIQREEKRQKIQEIAEEEGIPLIHCSNVVPVYKLDTTDLEQELLEDNQLYLNKIELGKQIGSIIDKGVVLQESLSRERKEALDLYRKHRPKLDISTVELRPWQEQAMHLFETPSERQVLWITGRQGNEGKSWFQSYIESFYGFNRVVRIDLRIKHANICNVLKKRSLASVDIFLFNDARSVCGEDINLYRILEDIKDGQATASKYDNDNIQFKTPNTVIIFSNGYPRTQKLSRDRWQIYNANQDGLNNVTLQILKMRRDGYDPQNKTHLKNYQL